MNDTLRHFHHRLHGNKTRRFMSVLVITWLITVFMWFVSPWAHTLMRFDGLLFYGMTTSISIWFLTDVVRAKIFRHHREGQAWVVTWPLALFIVVSIAIGFLVGTVLGDWYTGLSTYDLYNLAPERFLGIVLRTLAISMIFIVYFFLKNNLQVAKAQATDAKLKLLQSQLEPHMLFNTLANLRALIDISPPRATQMLDHLNDYLRATLGASRVQDHALALEFARLEDYLQLMQIRLGERLRFDLQLPQALQKKLVPALLLQPLVENAIKHGIEPSANGGVLTVSATQLSRDKASVLKLVVADTGAGMPALKGASHPPKTLKEGEQSFGLQQISERLHTLYGASAFCELSANSPSGIIATIELPMTNDHENNCAYC